MLDDDEPEGEERADAGQAWPSPRQEQAPLVTSDESPAPIPFVVWPGPATSAQWTPAIPFQGYETIEWPPVGEAAVSAAVPANAAPCLDGGPPSWATAICRTNVGTS